MKFVFLLLLILAIPSGAKQIKSDPSMSNTLIRGLAPNISQYSEMEREYISLFANKLKNRGYPLDQITRVDIKDPIERIGQFYGYNEVYIFINPAVHYKGVQAPGMQDLGLSWDEPTVVRHSDGSMEFSVGVKVKFKDFVPFFYRLDDSYENSPLAENHDDIVNKVDSVFLASKDKAEKEDKAFGRYFGTDNSVSDVTSQGIFELLHNYHIEIRVDKEREDIFDVYISRFEWKKVNEAHYHGTQDNIHLEVDCNKSTITVIKRFDPYFFPSPAIPPRVRENLDDDESLFDLIPEDWDQDELL